MRAAADRLGVGYSTLKQWIYRGRVRTTRTPGGHHRISAGELARLLGRLPAPGPEHPSPRPPSEAIAILSGRNRLRGCVEEVRSDGLIGQVRLRIGDQRLTAVITADAIAELDLRPGDDALAIIKATEVMIGRETPLDPTRDGGARVAPHSPATPPSRRARR